MKLLDSLEWRYATKKFNPTQKLDDAQVAQLKKAVQLSASSYGLQGYKILDIRDKELREKLKPAAWGQTQVTDASHLFVFCSFKNVKPAHVDEYLDLKSKIQNLDRETLNGAGDFMKKKIGEMAPEENQAWASRQVYIAVGNLLAAAAELEIDACPMEGFEADKFDEILGLSEKNLVATTLVTLGYRSSEDSTQDNAKVRKPIDHLFDTI